MPNAIRYFKALSDETRLRLMSILDAYELSVNELVSLLEMGQSRVSRHLKILTEAQLLKARRDGLWMFYSAVTEGEGASFLKSIASFLQEDPVLRADADMAARIIEDRALKTRQFFNSIAEHWDTLSRDVLGGVDIAGTVCESMPEGCEVAVDLGCGTGTVLERMRGHAKKIIGVDGSPRMLELSRRRLALGPLDGQDAPGNTGDVSLRIGELHHLPLRDGEADFVSINMVLHHLSDPGSALTEIRRVLKPEGTVIVTDFDHHTQEHMRSEYGDLWLGFDLATLEIFFASAGLRLISNIRRPVGQDLALNLTVAQKI